METAILFACMSLCCWPIICNGSVFGALLNDDNFEVRSQNLRKSDHQLRSCLSVRQSELNNLAPTGRGRILMKFDIFGIFLKYVEKIKVLSKYDLKKRAGSQGTGRILMKF